MFDPDYFDKLRGRTMRVADVIPEEAFETSPIGKGFTFGDLLRHMVAIERWMYAENAQGRPSRYDGYDGGGVRGKAATLAHVRELHDEAMEIFRSLDDGALRRPCTTPGGATMATWKWLRAMLEHEAHHRGQIYTYLSILGVPAPPLYGLTSEEVQARSVR
ncbi:MAG TPA: DinB family protein [Thermoanaerobaculia bacterium]|nr:DinB family protein [Thermoanaerobaculia bacterium]